MGGKRGDKERDIGNVDEVGIVDTDWKHGHTGQEASRTVLPAQGFRRSMEVMVASAATEVPACRVAMGVPQPRYRQGHDSHRSGVQGELWSSGLEGLWSRLAISDHMVLAEIASPPGGVQKQSPGESQGPIQRALEAWQWALETSQKSTLCPLYHPTGPL